jgi:hypothetical protein
VNLHEFVDRFEYRLAFKAPELWPAELHRFFREIKERYDPVAEVDEETDS